MNINNSELRAIEETSNKFTKIVEGAVFSTNQGNCIVIKYNSSSSIKVQFLNTGGITTCRASNLRSGRVADPLHKSVFSVGYLDNTPTTDEHGKFTHYYIAWKAMLARWHKDQLLKKYNITIDEAWFSLKNFKEWYEREAAPFLELGISPEVDSDLYALIHNTNKHYSASSCVLLTKSLNAMLASLKKELLRIQLVLSQGGRLPAGIQYESSRKRFHLKVFGKHYRTFRISGVAQALKDLRAIRINRFLNKAQEDIGVLSDKAILLINEIR